MHPYSKCLFANHKADYTALASFTSEASLLAGNALQPRIPAGLFDGPDAVGRTLLLRARGVLGSTGTPTYLFTVRMGITIAAITDAAVASSAAITTASGVSTKRWELNLFITCRTPGQGAGGTTFSVDGSVVSYGGFASPFGYNLTQAGGESGTWTVAPANFDPVKENYLNLSATCSASSASNTITCKNLELLLLG
jgi:hypothetical protein